MINKKYTPTKKNGGRAPLIKDRRMMYITAACGKCYECRKQKANSWRVRMMEELKEHKIAYFVTLTIDDSHYNDIKGKYGLEKDNDIATKAVRMFLERCRKANKGKSIKHWFITEKGHEKSKRVHLHGIIYAQRGAELCKQHWNNGFVYIGNFVNEKSINYIVKYMLKPDTENEFDGKVLCSPGLGKNYIFSQNAKNNRYRGEKTNLMYRTRSGIKVRLPMYYQNQLYTEWQKEYMWKKRLDKGLVYIMGEECPINTREYYECLMWYQQRSETVHKCAPPQWDQQRLTERLTQQHSYKEDIESCC